MNIIEFPGLWGLKLNIDPVALKVGIFTIHWYGVIIAVGFMLAVFLGMKNSKNFGIDSENIIDLVLFAAPVAIIGARLYYVVFKWNDYKSDPLEIFKIWHGGLAIYGGILGALLTAFIFARVKKIGVFKLFDFGLPYFALAQAIGRWGNFINQEAFGTNTSLPWGMTSDRIKNELSYLQMQGVSVDPNLPVHPAFLYESLWNFGVFLVLIWYRKRKKIEGEVFFLYMILYGLGRACIEGIRTDSLMLGNLRISQVLSVVFALVFAIAFYMRRRKLAAGISEVTEIGSSEYGNVLKKLKDEENENVEITEEVSESTNAPTDKEVVEEPEADEEKKEDTAD